MGEAPPWLHGDMLALRTRQRFRRRAIRETGVGSKTMTAFRSDFLNAPNSFAPRHPSFRPPRAGGRDEREEGGNPWILRR